MVAAVSLIKLVRKCVLSYLVFSYHARNGLHDAFVCTVSRSDVQKQHTCLRLLILSAFDINSNFISGPIQSEINNDTGIYLWFPVDKIT